MYKPTIVEIGLFLGTLGIFLYGFLSVHQGLPGHCHC